MKTRALSILLITAGLAAPAMAQSSASNSGSQTTSSSSAAMSPQDLSGDQIREVQQALQDKGNASNLQTDGVWGPKTEQALKKFQKSQKINANGQLDSQTVAALGVNDLQAGQMKSSGGVSGSSSSNTAPSSPSSSSSLSSPSSSSPSMKNSTGNSSSPSTSSPSSPSSK